MVSRGMGKKANERYQTCEEFAEDLIHVYGLIQQQITSTDFESPGRLRPVRRPCEFRIHHDPTVENSGTGIRSGTPLPSRARYAVATPPPQTSTEMDRKTAIAPNIPVTPDASPTVLSPQTQATISGPATDIPELVPGIDIAANHKSSSEEMVFTGIAALLVLAALSWAIVKLLGNPEVKAPSTTTTKIEQPKVEKKTQPPPTIVQNGWLALNVQPWAKVSSIKDAKGNVISAPQTATPCKISLQPGKYEITLTNSQFKPLLVEVDIQPNQVLLVNKRMEGFDYEKAVDSLGL